IPGRRGGAPRGEGALANLVSGGTVSTPRSLIRVGGAPRRAAPLYISGAVRQPTFRPGRRSLGPTGPVPPGGSGPIRLSVFAGAPPARIPPSGSSAVGSGIVARRSSCSEVPHVAPPERSPSPAHGG